MNEIRVFTDGACQGNGRPNAKASYACWFPDNKEWSFSAKLSDEETQTNQRGELKAIATAVKIAHDKCGNPSIYHLRIFTDSDYSRNCLTSWLPKWIANDWKTTDGKSVVHRDLIEDTSMILPKFGSYTFTHVKAHTKGTDELSVNNAIVDKMAVDMLNPPAHKETHAITKHTGPFETLDFTIMGPPVNEYIIVDWCKQNLDKLDKVALQSALFAAFQKTIRKNGYEIEKQRINNKKVVRLLAKSHLIAEGPTVVKEDE
jgi:ribonuclease HI